MERALHSKPSSNFAFASRLVLVLVRITIQNGNSGLFSDDGHFKPTCHHPRSRRRGKELIIRANAALARAGRARIGAYVGLNFWIACEDLG